MQLQNVRILDLTRLLPGPYATQLLADMGAEVIKVEDPVVGDYAREVPPTGPDGVGVVFSAVNRGKRSVTLDLKSEEGREVFYRLVSEADAVVEQFRPGVAERLGVDFDTLEEHNSELVYCSLSGFGQTGPYRERVGHDLNYASIAGLVDMTRDGPDDDPTIPGVPVGDMAGGTFTALSVLGALLSNALGDGEGNYIDVSMTDALLSFSQAVMPMALLGKDPRPGETELTGEFPCYDVYETADGRYLSIAALEPKFWRELCRELDRPELEDQHRAEDPATRAAVRETLAETFRSAPLATWDSRLGDADVMFAPVKTPAEALEDPQVQHRGIVRESETGPDRIGYPAIARRGLDAVDETIPDKGEHTREVLRSVGVEDDQFAELDGQDVV